MKDSSYWIGVDLHSRVIQVCVLDACGEVVLERRCKGGGLVEGQELVKDLEAIQVRVFEFEKPGMYSMADIEPVLKQVQAQGWKNIMTMRDDDERVEMWMREGSANGGLVFVATEADGDTFRLQLAYELGQLRRAPVVVILLLV